MYKILFLTKHSKKVLDIFEKLAPSNYELSFCHLLESPEKEIIKLVENADFIILHGEISEHIIASAKNLKLLQLLSVGYDHINLQLLKDMKVTLANASGTNANAVAEMTITLILALYRHIINLDQELRNGNWDNRYLTDIDSMLELSNKTVGIIGLGKIGIKVATMLSGFNTRILGYGLYSPTEQETLLNIERVSLKTLLKKSDIVTLHIPLKTETRGFIGETELSIMKRSALLINTSRGPIVDEKALINSLKNRSILGAGLDVFENEPIEKDNPLLKLDNVVLSPHCAGKSFEGWHRRIEVAYENIERFINGKEVLNRIPRLS